MIYHPNTTNTYYKILNEQMCRSGNIILKPFSSMELTDRYRSWFHDPDVTRWNSHGLFPYTREKSKDFLKTIQGNSNSSIIFAIYLEDIFDTSVKPPTKALMHIGNVSLQQINYINRSVEIAWVIGDKSCWGKGYGTIAGRLALVHAFDKLNMNRVWTGIASGNKGMIRVAEKLGMSREGIFREAVYLNGQYCNIIAMSILKEEYEDVKHSRTLFKNGAASEELST